MPVPAAIDCVATGFSKTLGDCNDADGAIKPGATEVAGDARDQNCDGSELCYADADNDGYRPNATATVVSANLVCTDAGERGASAPTTDCNDLVATIYPGAAEVVAGGALDSTE